MIPEEPWLNLLAAVIQQARKDVERIPTREYANLEIRKIMQDEARDFLKWVQAEFEPFKIDPAADIKGRKFQ